MDRASLLARFEILFPLAVAWAAEQERTILREGVPLKAQEILDAKALDVGQPDRVRLLCVPQIPRPQEENLRAACDAIDFLTPATRGLTLGYGILVRSDYWRDRELIAHELVHVAQYERFGGLEPFLRQYLIECLTVGYADSPLEREAIKRASALLAL
jgi:hypothetical protein